MYRKYGVRSLRQASATGPEHTEAKILPFAGICSPVLVLLRPGYTHALKPTPLVSGKTVVPAGTPAACADPDSLPYSQGQSAGSPNHN